MPITVSLDPHANMTRAMTDLADALVPYRTYPHVDMKPAGAQAMRLLLERIRRGRPWARAFAEVDFLIPLTMQCTMVPPMSLVLEAREALAAEHGVVPSSPSASASPTPTSPAAASPSPPMPRPRARRMRRSPG